MPRVSGPDFIIAGTQKAGTTWLKDHLASHPAVSMVRGTPHYFDQGWKTRSEESYRKLFTPTDGQIAGEKSTEYFDTLDTVGIAQRMRAMVPDVKVIVILRDPVQRAISAFDHLVISGLIPAPSDPEAELFADRHGHRVIERGEYLPQIESYLSVFAPEQFLTLIFEEDVVANPVEGLRKVQEFLGLEATPPPENVGEAVNKRRLSRLGVTLTHKVRKIPKARSIVRELDRFSRGDAYKTAWPETTPARLAQHYAPHNERLFEFLGRPIPSWKTPA